VLVISTDKGLCGALNTNLYKQIRDSASEGCEFVTAGRKLRTLLGKLGKTLKA